MIKDLDIQIIKKSYYRISSKIYKYNVISFSTTHDKITQDKHHSLALDAFDELYLNLKNMNFKNRIEYVENLYKSINSINKFKL